MSYRTEHSHGFTSTRVVPDAAHPWQATVNASRVEYTLVIRDEHGNALYRRGSSERPGVILLPGDHGSAGPSGDAPPSPGGYYLTAGILAGAGFAAAGVGAYFTVRREQAAHEWNSASCEQPGATRGEQCADVDQRRATAEHLALGFYVGSGALPRGQRRHVAARAELDPVHVAARGATLRPRCRAARCRLHDRVLA